MQDMQEQNPYSPPQSNLTKPMEQTQQKYTIEEALNADYDFEIGAVISQAWKAVNGMKLNVFLGALVLIGINIIFALIDYLIPATTPVGIVISFTVGLLFNAVTAAVSAGYAVMALKHLRQEPVSFSQDFFSISAVFSVLLIASLGSIFLTALGFLLLILPGIYLSFAYLLTSWIIVDHPNIGAWEAMEASRKLISKHWFKVFGLCFVLGLIVFISAIPLGIGLFWTIPLSLLSLGVVYQTIFNA